MAIYHLSTKPVSRGLGRSATAAAAYRAGELVHDVTSDQIFDYSRKRGVEHSEIVLPSSAAKSDINWARDRQALWNAAEIAEKRKDARVAREYEVALPHELTREQRVALVREFSMELANRFGVAVDFSIHLPHRSGDDRNHHAHILTTTREVTAVGLGNKSSIELSDTDRRKKGLEPSKVEVKAIRERWAVLTNEHLLEQGVKARVDHRSLEEQGINRIPTTHLGPAVSALERRGVETEVGKRIAWQRAELAQERLERAAEIGRIERERAQVEKSILDLSGDVGSARRGREVEKSSAAELSSPAAKPTLEERQAEGRRLWLEGRERAKQAEELARREVAEVRLDLGPLPKPEAARQAERLASLSAMQLEMLIERVKPPSVDQLVERDAMVSRARGVLEDLQASAAQAARHASQAAAEAQAWREAHAAQAKLHDMKVRSAAYLAAREAAQVQALEAQRRALAAAKEAQRELEGERSEARERFTQDTAPARDKVAELKALAKEAYGRETRVREFEQLVHNRAAGHRAYLDAGDEWKATPAVLRSMVDRFNRERPEVRAEILKELAMNPEASRKLEKLLELRHEHGRNLDHGLEL